MDTRSVEIDHIGFVEITEFDTRALEAARQYAERTGGTLYTYCGSDEHYYWRGAHVVNRLSYVVAPRDLGETFIANGSSEEDFTLGRLEGDIAVLKTSHCCHVARVQLRNGVGGVSAYFEHQLENALGEYRTHIGSGQSATLWVQLFNTSRNARRHLIDHEERLSVEPEEEFA